MLLSFNPNQIRFLRKSVHSHIFNGIRFIWRMNHLLSLQWFYLFYFMILGRIFYLFSRIQLFCFSSALFLYFLAVIVNLLWLIFWLMFTRLKLSGFSTVFAVCERLVIVYSLEWFFRRFVYGGCGIGGGFFGWDNVLVRGCEFIGEV